MNLQEKELIEQARMMGVPAHEFSEKFIARDLVEAVMTAVRKNTKLKENQEAKLIDDLNDAVKDLISSAVAVIAANGRSAIVTTVKSVMVAGKTIRVVSDVDTSDPQRHALTDTVNHRALLVLAPDEYYDALDSNKPQKDQNDLPLEENPLGALQQLADESVKGTGLTATVVPDDPVSPYELAFIHVTNGGEISAKAIQVAAGVKRKDVTDIILTLASNGIISQPDDEGLRTLIPADQRPMTVAEVKHGHGSAGKEEPSKEPAPFDEDQYADAILLVQREKKVSVSFLKSNFAVTEETAEAMILRMEQDGVISAPNDIGGRAIYD
jgi:DNA segregation ATPase FtsK/SpoIIIE-like protein